MKNILEMSLEEVRIENDKLYNSFVERCDDLQPKLRDVKEKIQTTERMTEEEFYNKMIERGRSKEDYPYENYLKFVDNLYKSLLTALSNLSCEKTEFSDEFRQDYGMINKALSYYFDLKASHDYVTHLYERFNDYFVELEK